MRVLIIFLSMTLFAILLSCGQRSQLRVRVSSVGTDGELSGLVSLLESSFVNALNRDSVEIITDDYYLLQCSLSVNFDSKQKVKKYVIHWSFLNLDFPEENPMVRTSHDLDSTEVVVIDPQKLSFYAEPFTKGFIRQLIKKKIVKIKQYSKATRYPNLVAFIFGWFFVLVILCVSEVLFNID